MAFFIAIASGISACGDKNEAQEKADNTAQITDAKTNGMVNQKPADLTACDTYMAQMKACLNKNLAQQDKAQLDTALGYLKEQIEKSDDKLQIAQQCQKGLDTIDEQKKVLNCI